MEAECLCWFAFILPLLFFHSSINCEAFVIEHDSQCGQFDINFLFVLVSCPRQISIKGFPQLLQYIISPYIVFHLISRIIYISTFAIWTVYWFAFINLFLHKFGQCKFLCAIIASVNDFQTIIPFSM